MENPDPQPVRAGIGEPQKSDDVIATTTFSLLLIWSPSLQVGRGKLGRRQYSAVLVASSFFSLLYEFEVVEQIRLLPAWRLKADVRQEAASLALCF
jgi:hypothetical protein